MLVHVYQIARYHICQRRQQNWQSVPRDSKTQNPSFLSVNNHITCYWQFRTDFLHAFLFLAVLVLWRLRRIAAHLKQYRHKIIVHITTCRLQYSGTPCITLLTCAFCASSWLTSLLFLDSIVIRPLFNKSSDLEPSESDKTLFVRDIILRALKNIAWELQ